MPFLCPNTFLKISIDTIFFKYLLKYFFNPSSYPHNATTMETKTKTLTETELQICQTVLENGKDSNNVLTAVNVPPIFQTHVFNVETGKHGIKHLISEILNERGASFPKDAHTTELRPIVIAASMFASDIKDEVDARFAAGSTRYPYSTVHQYLSVFMVKEGMICKVQLSNAEDAERHCCKPRTKYYLNASNPS